MGVIYKIQNRESGKIYVGQTTRTLEIRMQEHLRKVETYVERAIAKHGIDAFDVSVIEEYDSEEKLNDIDATTIVIACNKPNRTVGNYH